MIHTNSFMNKGGIIVHMNKGGIIVQYLQT